MSKLITVTAEDIKAGKKFSAVYCPVALAVNRGLGIYWYTPNFRAMVGSYTISYFKKHTLIDKLLRRTKFKRLNYEAPIEVNNFIRSFDNGGDVKPFSFYLEYPLTTWDYLQKI